MWFNIIQCHMVYLQVWHQLISLVYCAGQRSLCTFSSFNLYMARLVLIWISAARCRFAYSSMRVIRIIWFGGGQKSCETFDKNLSLQFMLKIVLILWHFSSRQCWIFIGTNWNSTNIFKEKELAVCLKECPFIVKIVYYCTVAFSSCQQKIG